jgi:hypothetical protein
VYWEFCLQDGYGSDWSLQLEAARCDCCGEGGATLSVVVNGEYGCNLCRKCLLAPFEED